MNRKAARRRLDSCLTMAAAMRIANADISRRLSFID
jgi:hypothetical protein